MGKIVFGCVVALIVLIGAWCLTVGKQPGEADFRSFAEKFVQGLQADEDQSYAETQKQYAEMDAAFKKQDVESGHPENAELERHGDLRIRSRISLNSIDQIKTVSALHPTVWAALVDWQNGGTAIQKSYSFYWQNGKWVMYDVPSGSRFPRMLEEMQSK